MDDLRPNIRSRADGEASVSFDGRYSPVVVVTWVGAPTLALVEQAQAWIDEAYADARAMGSSGIVLISDATRGRLPSVEARRGILELRHDPDLMLGVIAVVPIRNAVLHGLVRALTRALGQASRFTLAASFEQALDFAEQIFVRNGLAVPESLDRLRIERRE